MHLLQSRRGRQEGAEAAGTRRRLRGSDTAGARRSAEARPDPCKRFLEKKPTFAPVTVGPQNKHGECQRDTTASEKGHECHQHSGNNQTEGWFLGSHADAVGWACAEETEGPGPRPARRRAGERCGVRPTQGGAATRPGVGGRLVYTCIMYTYISVKQLKI